MKKSLLLSALFLMTLILPAHYTWAQNGKISGIVKDMKNDTLIVGASIYLEGTSIGTFSDSNGKFLLADVPAKTYNIIVQSIGYEQNTIFNIALSSGNTQNITIKMEDSKPTALKEVVIRKNPFAKNPETPLSLQNLSAQEIRSNPGGNFDISRVIQAFPGVGGTSGSVGGYRNDLIIRGGAPNENVYYLDGVEVPVINHFSTQGSAGGPTGIINISFIQDVNLYTSAFPAKYDNPLSGILQMKTKEAVPEKPQHNIRLSASELAFSSEGPINSKWSYQASVRRSYLQVLFKALELPILPSYWDYQYKLNYKINKKLNFYTMAIGSIDDFKFTIPKSLTAENIYILTSNPFIKQWSYTNGYGLKKLITQGYWNLTFSRNMLNNQLNKYKDNQNPVEADRTLKIKSVEAETKLRFDVNKFYKRWSYSYGAMAQYDKYDNEAFIRFRNEITDSTGRILQPAINFKTNTQLSFVKYGAFGQIAGNFLDNKLTLSAGLRMDANTFMTNGNNPLQQLSPRVAASLKLLENLKWNTSIGRYYKIPTYTILGYTDSLGQYVNKNNSYIQSDHIVTGVEFMPNWKGSRFTLEGFYKKYAGYPVSLVDNISLANKGGDFGFLGNEAVTDKGEGRAYGVEFQFQQKFTKNVFVVLSVTQFKTEFTDNTGKYIPASWDNGTLISFIGGYKFKRNIELGAKFRYQGGSPYSPFNEAASVANYSILGTGVIDYNQFNTLRLSAFHSMDIRIDKKWNYKKWTLDLFLDVTNAYGAQQTATPQFTFKRNADNTDFLTTDGKALKADGSNGIPLILANASGTTIPTVGFIVEF